MNADSIPRFNTVEQQRKLLIELLTHVHIGNELLIHLAGVSDTAMKQSQHPFTQVTIVIPGMDRRLLEIFGLAMRQYGIAVEYPQLAVRKSDSVVAHRAGTPRVVGVNLIAHRRFEEGHRVDLEALVQREDSYLSAIATLWMIILNPEYAQWLVEIQDEYKYILLPGLTNNHVFGQDSEEQLVLGISLGHKRMSVRWFATDIVPLGSISPVVAIDPESDLLALRPIKDDVAAGEE